MALAKYEVEIDGRKVRLRLSEEDLEKYPGAKRLDAPRTGTKKASAPANKKARSDDKSEEG